MISIKLSTSEMAGTPSNMTISSARIAAGIKATTLFFAPEIVTSPFKGLPPLITILRIHSKLSARIQPFHFNTYYSN
jgi:hypothetical protein